LNKIQVFNNTEFGEIRTAEIEGKPYFMATDIAKALGYSRPNDAISAHCRATVKHSTPISGKMQEVNFIPEGDVYRLIARSKLPQAEKFEKWVFDEVLPSIRKTGGYIAGQEHMTDDELLANAILVAQRKIAERDKVIQAQNDTITELKPKAVFADAVSSSKTSILIGDMAKLLRQNGIEIGQKRLFDWLRNNGYLIKRKGSDWNMPTQRSVEMGLFEIKESTHLDGNGCNITTKTSKVTGKGQVYFINKFLKAI
jgi:anti-repressor protein